MKKEIELEREIIYAQENKQRIRYLLLLIKRYIISIGGDNMKLKERIKSPVFWTELVLLIAGGLRLFGIYDMSSNTVDIIQGIITALFTLFATLNNPTDRKNF